MALAPATKVFDDTFMDCGDAERRKREAIILTAPGEEAQVDNWGLLALNWGCLYAPNELAHGLFRDTQPRCCLPLITIAGG